MLEKKYQGLGFQLSESDGICVLRYRNRIVFVLGENVNMRNGFIGKLCDAYLTLSLA